MKKYILNLVFLFSALTLHSQSLYTENFNNLAIGNLGTDVTGTVAGKGGWYTESIVDPAWQIVPSNTEYQIVAEPNKGNVLQVAPMAIGGEQWRLISREDLKSYWQQRTPGNNVLKVSFDLYTGDGGKDGPIIRMYLFSDEGRLLTFTFLSEWHYISGLTGGRGDFTINGIGTGFASNQKAVTLPVDTWVTFETYIDFNNNKVYYSIPSLNFTAVKDAGYKFDLSNVEHDDSPVKLLFSTNKHGDVVPLDPYTPKFDNINISAQNTVPTVSVDEFLSSQFNLYPNPATNIVNITNNDNLFVQQVKIYDLTGKLLSTQNFNNEAEIQLNVETLNSGIYMLHLQTDQGIAVKKLIKK